MTKPAGDANRTVVHLLRHGEVHNPTGVLYGRQPDFHLSDLGREMADTVAAHLADHGDVVVGKMGSDRVGHLATEVRQVEVRLSAIEHAGGVVHLSMTKQMHDSPVGVTGRLCQVEIVANDSETAFAVSESFATIST